MPSLPPYVSVIMAVYNGERYLRQATESILNQTFGDFEFIIIDDGSTDGTLDILTSYADPRVRLVRNEENIGLTKSLNKGLALARGEYIARQDADDISHSERLAKQVQFLSRQPRTGVLGTAYRIIDLGGVIVGTARVPTGNADIQAYLLTGNCLCHGSVMLRRDCLSEVGGYDDSVRYAQDYDLWLRMGERFELANLPEALYDLRLHSTSVSSTSALQQRQCARIAIERAIERRFKEDGDALVSNHALAKSYLHIGLLYVIEGNVHLASCYFRKSVEVCPDPGSWQRDFGLLTARRAIGTYQFVLRPSIGHAMAAAACVDFVDKVFRCVPFPLAPNGVKLRILSELWITMAFACYQTKVYSEVPKLCLLGVRADPTWLRNRGVWSIFARSLFRSWRS